MSALPDGVIRYLRTLAAIEREAMLADDTPPWLVGLLGAVDPDELKVLIQSECPRCGRPMDDPAHGIAEAIEDMHSVRHDLVADYVDGAQRLGA